MAAWVLPVALAAGSALVQNEQNKDIARANRANAEAAAIQTQFSPYTDFGPGSYKPQQEGSVLNSAMQGALMGMSFQNAGGDKSTAKGGESVAVNTTGAQSVPASSTMSLDAELQNMQKQKQSPWMGQQRQQYYS